MEYYMQELEIDISKLNIVHVAGSKGKGSTCAFVESALRRYGYKTGSLYTSPHIQSLCERFCINGKQISKETYLRHFSVVWSKLQEIKQRPSSELPPYITRWPGFFRFLTLIAFRVFIEANVDVVVLEVGMGGRLDATNVVQHPITTGITLIDLEHTQVLGNTLEQIAFEKAGIFKRNSPAVVLQQRPEVMQVFRQCAEIEGISAIFAFNRRLRVTSRFSVR
ncbi:uncharacterized protein [Blastocystis hominis]|uniref:Folylpoly-gamma-glutamate synthetase n=1 Tax=Blastocystis hominis TaxID=12968 RepID=D8M1B6_BLAHO|nr:uncharacterized protein [Blastocystis hominis]CBK21855.2 unnamed protein product [Blastocystis hominis]|eukprot:XP_012895903.1 uncharacterized protein [Blastocystis hominis]